MQRQSVKFFFLENLDYIAIFLGLTFSSFILFWFAIGKTQNPRLGIALIIATSVYIAFKNRDAIQEIAPQKMMKYVFEIFFFFFFSASLWILFIGDGSTVVYYIVIAFCVGFLSLSILNVKSVFEIVVQIIKVFIVSLSLKYSLFYFSWGRGIDYFTHQLSIFNVIQFGNIGNMERGYNFFPLMHIQSVITQIVTNLPIKDATWWAIIFPLVLSSLCIFLIASRLTTVSTGLLAMLIVNIADYTTRWGSEPIPTTFGICLFYFLVFVIFLSVVVEKNRTWWYIISVIFVIAMIFSHTLSSFVFVITLVSIVVGSYLYRSLWNIKEEVFPPPRFVITVVISLVFYWGIAMWSETSSSFFDVILKLLDYGVSNKAAFMDPARELVTTLSPSLIESTLDTLGNTLLLCLTAIGCFYLLSKKFRSKYLFSLMLCGIFLISMIYGFQMVGLNNILPHRWFAFSYFFLAILAALALLVTVRKLPNQWLSHLTLFIIMIFLTFFMSAGTVVNADNPLWLKKDTLSTAYSFQEGVGAETLVKYSSDLMVDQRYSSVPRYLTNTYESSSQVTVSIYNTDDVLVSTPDTVFIWRQYMLERPILFNQYYKNTKKVTTVNRVMGENFVYRLERVEKIYDNYGVRGYYIGEQ